MYSINKEVEITNITFEKSLRNTYSKSREKRLTGLVFSLRRKRHSKEKECYLIRNYNYEVTDLEESKQLIDVVYFYELVDKLNKMNTENLHQDFSVADGVVSSITISGNNYTISFRDNWEEETKAEFYNLFKSVWDNYNK